LKKIFLMKVLNNVEISPRVHKIEMLRASEIGEIFPGQFLHIKCSEEGILLRRPISISYSSDKIIGVIIKNVGKGTELLCNSKVGQMWDVLGPLGNGFTVNEEHRKIMIIGAGIGSAPLLELAKNIRNREVLVLLGYKEKGLLEKEFEKYAKTMVATEDGSMGYKGLITSLAQREIERFKPDVIYACGPQIVLKWVQKTCGDQGISAQLSIEERMACGIGACLVCACKLAREQDEYKYVRVCKEGPVFHADEVILDE